MSNLAESPKEIIMKRAFRYMCENVGYKEGTIKSFKLFIDNFNKNLQLELPGAELNLIVKFPNSLSQESPVVELDKLIELLRPNKNPETEEKKENSQNSSPKGEEKENSKQP
jgi:hypothetical protein